MRQFLRMTAAKCGVGKGNKPRRATAVGRAIRARLHKRLPRYNEQLSVVRTAVIFPTTMNGCVLFGCGCRRQQRVATKGPGKTHKRKIFKYGRS